MLTDQHKASVGEVLKHLDPQGPKEPTVSVTEHFVRTIDTNIFHSDRQYLARVPASTTVVAAKFVHSTRVVLVVEPKVPQVIPLHYGKLVATPNSRNDRGRAPISGVLAEDRKAIEIAPVDLNMHDFNGGEVDDR